MYSLGSLNDVQYALNAVNVHFGSLTKVQSFNDAASVLSGFTNDQYFNDVMSILFEFTDVQYFNDITSMLFGFSH